MSLSKSTPSLTLFELRHYRMRPGRRDALLEMFDAHFRPAYEAAGATILGSFCAPDAPDDWYWVRAFPDAAAREAALRGFYGGEVWARLGPACNTLLARVCSARVLRAVSGGDLGTPLPREHLQAAVPRPRPWVLSQAARKGAVEVGDAGGPPALVLASSRATVRLRRFESDQQANDWLRQRSMQAAPPVAGRAAVVADIRLQPTAASRLR